MAGVVHVRPVIAISTVCAVVHPFVSRVIHVRAVLAISPMRVVVHPPVFRGSSLPAPFVVSQCAASICVRIVLVHRLIPFLVFHRSVEHSNRSVVLPPVVCSGHRLFSATASAPTPIGSIS